jgi:hypothetical protein
LRGMYYIPLSKSPSPIVPGVAAKVDANASLSVGCAVVATCPVDEDNDEVGDVVPVWVEEVNECPKSVFTDNLVGRRVPIPSILPGIKIAVRHADERVRPS